MTRWILPLMILASSGLTVAAAEAQVFNPYFNRYRDWNCDFPGYSRGSGSYRRQVRDLNPYGDLYRSFGTERRETLQWLGLD